jgi:hypothetical protein
MKMTRDTPTGIAGFLIEQNSLDDAMGVAMEKAGATSDIYGLRV